MPARPQFGRRFRELIAGETQEKVAARLGISQPSVSRMGRGFAPGPQILERLIREYNLDEAEWRSLAWGSQDTEEARVEAIALRAAEEALRLSGISAPSGAHRLVAGLAHLSQKHGRPIPVDLSGGVDS